MLIQHKKEDKVGSGQVGGVARHGTHLGGVEDDEAGDLGDGQLAGVLAQLFV